MRAFDKDDLISRLEGSHDLYVEFLRVPALSAGLYRLRAGSIDPQTPHNEDEVYVVLEGRGSIRVGEEERSVGPGSVVFVDAGVEHRFHTIEEAITVVVLFAPAETPAES